MRIAFFNPQGNFDKKDSYWTQHPDFGGQLVYVKEIAAAMAALGYDVDIIARQVEDENWPEFKETLDSYEGIENLRIVRIPCGPKEFLVKEKLWEHLSEWVDNIIAFYKAGGSMPDFVTTHYADGGLSGVLFKERTGIPYSFTGHSLGAQKMDKLHTTRGNISIMDDKYRFTKRIAAERIAMLNASLIVVSTAQERDEQYKHHVYLGAGDVNNPEKFKVVPPGANTEVFSAIKENDEEPYVRALIKKMFERDIDEDRRDLPDVIAASRLDPKKNHVGLVKSYANSKELQSIANLVITLRGIENVFEDYSNVKQEEKKIIDEIMELIRDYDLKGKVSMFSINGQGQLAACYRELAKRKSVFCLTAVYEPFGLAPIEAMSTGLPVAVTKYGGPSEVLFENNEEYGVLLDVFNTVDISKGILEVFNNYDYYKKQGMYRVESKYTWDSTAKNYISGILDIKNKVKDSNGVTSNQVCREEVTTATLGWLKEIYFE